MSETLTVIDKHVHLSAERAERLSRLAQTQGVNEDRVIEKALDILFNLAELFDERAARQGWSLLSEVSLQRIWDNEEDARYDHWRDLYGVSAVDQRLRQALEL